MKIKKLNGESKKKRAEFSSDERIAQDVSEYRELFEAIGWL